MIPARTRTWAGALLAAAGLLMADAACAGDLDLRFEGEARWFYHSQDADTDLPASAAVTIEGFTAWREDKERINAELFARKDSTDPARTHADIRELYYEVLGSDFELRLGNRRVYWGVTESRHLVDIINQSDFVEDLDNEAKLGQPMLNITLIRDIGSVDLFFMPYQRARTFPGRDGHPRLPFPVAANDAQYQSQSAQRHIDFAVRYRNSFGPLDLGVAYFNGTAREPRLRPCLNRGSGFRGTGNGPNCDILSGIIVPTSPFPAPANGALLALCDAPTSDLLAEACLLPSEDEVRAGIEAQVLANLVLVPYYARLSQLSVDAQYIWESLALKLEAVAREQQGDHSIATVSGFEYTFGDVMGSGWDIGALAEYLTEERDDIFSSRFDHDWFVGTRVALNDIASTQVLAGALVDSSGQDQSFQIEASRRLGDDWKLSMKFRDFEQIPRESPTAFLRYEDMLQFTLERFF